MTEQGFPSILSDAAAKVEAALTEALSGGKIGSGSLAEAMRYAALGGGKRIRAYLTLAFCSLFGGEEEAALPFACAIECVHAYSLAHDDLPCMDDDDMRRGKPSLHIAFGEATALLAGDALLTYAFELAGSNPHVSPKAAALAVTALAGEAGPRGMVGGQVIDMESELSGMDELYTMFDGKTAALIRAACLLGVYAATDSPSPQDVENIRRYADGVGIGFQVRDDMLDVTGNTAVLGKEAGSDAKNRKKTSLTFLSLEEADAEVKRLTDSACLAISGYPASENLEAFARWLSEREK